MPEYRKGSYRPVEPPPETVERHTEDCASRGVECRKCGGTGEFTWVFREALDSTECVACNGSGYEEAPGECDCVDRIDFNADARCVCGRMIGSSAEVCAVCRSEQYEAQRDLRHT